MQLILHVGLPKTATTTIQHVLDSQKPALAAGGLLYPGTTGSQVELVRRTQLRTPVGQTGPGSLHEAMERVAQEVRVVRPGTVVLSCERMSLVTVNAVARLQQAIAAGLPEVDAVRVLAYVRDPVAWATSICQQRLKMGTTRLDVFAADPWPLGVAGMLGKYVDHYGLAEVSVRHLRPDRLVNGNVVDDFMAAVGAPGFKVAGPVPVLNRALTLHGAQVADRLAELVPRGGRGRRRRAVIGRMLQDIGGPAFVLPRPVQDRILAAASGDIAYVCANWGVNLSTERQERVYQPALDDAAVMTLALGIVEEVERLEDEEGPHGDDGT